MSLNFNKITDRFIERLNDALGESDIVFETPEHLTKYGSDQTEDLNYLPELVLKPRTVDQISKVLQLCNQHHIPVTVRGAGTGLSGGALPLHGGIVIAMERFNSIIEIDEENLQATVEPGVINEVFQQAVAAKGLFYPPDPASKGSCFLGGNIAHNSGGPKAVKYGVTKDYVLNLEVVLASGEVIWTGANVLKNSTGYNFTQLMIGSEGTLGVITKIVFKLIPLPRLTKVMLVSFHSPEGACATVAQVFKAGVTPSGMEFMERDAIDFAIKYVSGVTLDIKPEIKAHLLIELDGNDEEVLMKDAEIIYKVMIEGGADEVLMAESEEQKQTLWKLRRKVGEAVKSNSVYKEEDTVVPRAALPLLLKGVKEIGTRYGFQSVCYGHAGDGNLHVNIIRGNMSDSQWKNELPKGIRELFTLCVKLNGTLSGEHGIGLVQKNYTDLVFNETKVNWHKGIKALFDPNGILNPGKIIP